MLDSLKYIWPVTTAILPISLVFWEFRQQRKLQVFYKTYDALLIATSTINEHSIELINKLMELDRIINQLEGNEKYDFIIERVSGDIDAIEEFKNIYMQINKKIEIIIKKISDIKFLSNYFVTNGKSYKQIMNVVSYLEQFIDKNYGNLLYELKFTYEEDALLVDNYKDILILVEEGEYKGVAINGTSYHLNTDDILGFIEYFNKNKLK